MFGRCTQYLQIEIIRNQGLNPALRPAARLSASRVADHAVEGGSAERSASIRTTSSAGSPVTKSTDDDEDTDRESDHEQGEDNNSYQDYFGHAGPQRSGPAADDGRRRLPLTYRSSRRKSPALGIGTPRWPVPVSRRTPRLRWLTGS